MQHNFKASYFGGALLIPQDPFAENLRSFFAAQKWNVQTFMELLSQHQATPEMLLYRMSQILPGVFNQNSLFYQRFTNSEDRLTVNLTKELNMTETLVPYGLGIREHYCRRWLPLRLLKKVRHNILPLTAGAQKIHFFCADQRGFPLF